MGSYVPAATSVQLGKPGVAEQLADGAILVDAADALCQQRRHRQDVQLLVGFVDRDRVGHHDLVDGGLGEAFDRPVGEDAVGGKHVDGPGPVLDQGVGDADQGAPGGDQVVDYDRVHALNLTDDVEDLDIVILGSPLVDDGEGCIEDLGHRPGPAGAADVRRDHHDVLVVPVADVLGNDLQRGEVVEGDVEEALDGIGVEVEGDDPVGAGQGDDVGHQLGRDRVPRRRLFLLAGVAVVGDDGGDPGGRGAVQGVEDDEQLHQVFGDRLAGGLDQEDVVAADRLGD